MVFMPPGSAKSTYCSKMFPAWFLGRNPTKNIIAASYSGDLATKFGKSVRNIVALRDYSDIFTGVTLSDDTKAKGEWETNHGGEYFACGVDGAVTGRRADGGLIDDPIKGRKDADSSTARQNAWDWYESDFMTRLKPGAWQIIVLTRWHEDDPVGRILPEDFDNKTGWVTSRQGVEWYVLCLPARAEDGDPLGRSPGDILWPEYLGPTLMDHEKMQSPRNWASLFQQRPSPDEGTFFKREWFNWYEAGDPPKHLRKYGSSDYGVTADDGDYTEHGIFGVDPNDDLYALEGWYGQAQADIWIDQKLKLIRKHKPLVWFGEAGQIRRAVEPFLKKRMRETKTYCRLEWIASTRDKVIRARGLQGRTAMGKFYVPNDDWGRRLVDQLLKFPAGALDDAVDMASLMGLVLDEMHPAIGQHSDKLNKPRDRWDDAFDRDSGDDGNWKTAL